MSDSSKPVRPPCLKCGSRNVAWIQWGKPVWSEKLKRQLDRIFYSSAEDAVFKALGVE